MGADRNYNGQGNLFATAPNDSNLDAGDSKLSNNANRFRNGLISRNLYNLNSAYPIPPNDIQKVVNSIDSVLNVLTPFKSFDLNNTVLGRIVGEKTPLSTIGLALLGKQFAYNEMSHIAQQTFPTINVSNLFDGNKNTKLFSFPENYSITKKTAKTGFLEFIQNLTSTYPSYNRPFNENSTSNDYLINTGEGQQQLLLTSLNRNLYKENNDVLNNVGISVGIALGSRGNYIGTNRTYFNFSSDVFNPYFNWKSDYRSEDGANFEMRTSYNSTAVDERMITQEYAPNNYFIYHNFGQPKIENDYYLGDITNKNNINSWIKIFPENIDNQIVWGRNNVDKRSNARLSSLRGDVKIDIEDFQDLSTKYNVRSGLLKYTSELLNSTKGNVVDTTRKIFMNGEIVEGFNGSAVWAAPDNSLPEFKNKIGLRQHSILDQYDRFAKAIRYTGNINYSSNKGNTNSVIYKTVRPRIHPIVKDINDKNWMNSYSKNLMFSIENLAIRTISNDGKYGIIDDEMGSTIPATEVGPFNGRIMWFPPYNVEVFETTSAKYESTVMVGRSEPIYNYQNSERSATLSFSLIIDYPPQLRNKSLSGSEKHRAISEFFAFGLKDDGSSETIISPPPPAAPPAVDPNPPTEPTTTEVVEGTTIDVFFPNDMPTTEHVDDVIDVMYNDLSYEEDKNKNIYNADSDQYSVIEDTNYLSNELKRIYENEPNRKQYEIRIEGGASKLYLLSKKEEYNKKLSQRRIDSVKKLIDSRLLAIFEKDAAGLGINYVEKPYGSANAPDSTAGATQADIDSQASVQSRYATIIIIKSAATPPPKEKTQTPTEKAKTEEIKKTNEEKNKKGYEAKINVNDNIFKEKQPDGKYSDGFGEIASNYYIPVFHSQTPEEFHRRLVFLQQCMRQGNALRKTDGKDLSIKNSVFGRQPICILRIADFFYTKIIIESLNIDYTDTTWDVNPEGFGMQPMLAKVTLQVKIIGGQSLVGPIDALQNAVSFNYYANSTFSDQGMYAKPYKAGDDQKAYIDNILQTETKNLQTKNNIK